MHLVDSGQGSVMELLSAEDSCVDMGWNATLLVCVKLYILNLTHGVSDH